MEPRRDDSPRTNYEEIHVVRDTFMCMGSGGRLPAELAEPGTASGGREAPLLDDAFRKGEKT